MKIKAISFNIRCVDDINGNSIAERAPRLSSVMSAYDADVIGFQEFTPVWAEYIDKYFGKDYVIFNRYRVDTGWLESTPILYKKDKFNLIKSGYFWLSDTPEVMSGGWDELNFNRICLYVILQEKASEKAFTFFNTHFGFGDENQVKSIRLIGQYSKELANYPAFVVGDFNMTPNTKGYEEAIKIFKDANPLAIEDREPTFHGYNQKEIVKTHIDYCFVNQMIKPINFKIIDELVEGQFISDHYGIFAELEF